MKTKKAIPRFYLLLVLLLLLIYKHSPAQDINPSTWQSFVAGSSNPTVRDTFKVQAFTATPSHDEWAYQATGNTVLFNPADEGIPDAPDGGALRMNPDSRFKVVLPSFEGHTDVLIEVIYAAWKVKPGENLYISTEREKESLNKKVYLVPPAANYSRSFTERKEESIAKISSIRIINNPTTFQLDASRISEISEGFYALDSAYAHGYIKAFSLFTGTGLWKETARWSHQPAFRHRNALINGTATIDSPVACNQIFLGNGVLDIAADQQLDINKLIFCGEEAALCSAGEVNIKEEVSVHYRFPAKGCWYFISFPFDVYPQGIDPGFTWKDNTPNDGGDYFYLHTYNGNKRGQNNQAESNWEIIPPTAEEDRPVFEKGKGYLIALDEKANKQTLTFSSMPGAVSPDFGKTGKLSIPLTAPPSSGKDHRGWYLCGNPLPCPLPTRLLASTDLDGFIYIYNGDGYEAYPLDEDHAIPPFSAFFVKAKKTTEIEIHSSAITQSNIILPQSKPLYNTKAEPRTSGSTVSSVSSPVIKRPNCYLNANSLFLEELLMPGVVYLWDIGGRLYWKEEVDAGSSVIHFPSALPPGSYIIRVDTKRFTYQYKLVWD
ncbi:T9SS type A sorting domain-containing protein [Parabacteroides sp. PF5-6]|uniref:T9SS type A sorting domain-containing protein n=1 Tax=Parabacteroides sp. PF5-6 TaxID=1742403 RepID=UPI002404CEC5|nr:T9SS type A sorting domain-containing protein [Parabacteroides sp. PF5-6]MDF9829190.1 hypothetical protein [Parabacteroides sp. PF5-6]